MTRRRASRRASKLVVVFRGWNTAARRRFSVVGARVAARAERRLATVGADLVQDTRHRLRHGLELGVGLEQLEARRSANVQ